MKDVRSSAPFDVGLPRIVRRRQRVIQTIPTGNVRHLPAIRNGKINYEDVFSRSAKSAIRVDPDVELELKRGRGKVVVTDAAKKIREGREESKARDAEKVRSEEGRAGVLRESKQVRPSRAKPSQQSKRDLQKGRKAQQPQSKPQKVKSQGRTPQKQKVKKRQAVKRKKQD